MVQKTILSILIVFLFIGCDGCGENVEVDLQDSANDESVSDNYPLPPLEVFFFDTESRPPDDGTDSTTYTADIYVVNNRVNSISDMLKGSTYPNSISNSNNTIAYNTVKSLGHLFNNLNGHDGSTQRGLNLIDSIDLVTRKSPAYHPNNPDTIAWYINVHKGFSNNGNSDSRGSGGCLTIHPNYLDIFFDNFDFSLPGGPTGTSTGVVYVIREDDNTRHQMIADLQNQYP